MPADLECPATPPELPREPTPTRVKFSPSRHSSGSPGRASPDSACPICLGKMDNKAFSDGCMHQFCFTCILEWSKVRAVCPLCKQPFTSIIHNVRSELDYDRYRLPPPPPDPQNPYIFQPGDGPESRSRWLQMRRDQYNYRSLMLPMLWPVPDGHEYHLPSAARLPRHRPPARARLTSASRRRLYESDMWARPTADELTGRYRETGPDFYRNNPACTHRLIPWLNRELNALLDSPVHLAHVMEHIMRLITRLHILSIEFREHLDPYLRPWTEHFVHELYCYARSPYDMVGYDLHVQYRTGRPDSPQPHVMPSDSSNDSGSDSDIRVLTPPPRPPTPILVEPSSSPEPGPSGGSGGSVVDGGVSAALSRVRAFLASARAAEAAAAGSSSESDSDGSTVEVVEVLPPRHERPPVIVTLSSDEEPPPPPQQQPKTEAKRRPARRERREREGERRERTRSSEDRSDRRRREGKRRSSRADKHREREERRAKRTGERAASKSSQSSAKSKSSQASRGSSQSGASSSSKSVAAISVSSKSSGSSWKPSDAGRSSSVSFVSSSSSSRTTHSSGTVERSSSHSAQSSRSVTSTTSTTIDDRSSKSSSKSRDRNHKSKSSDTRHKSKSSDRSHKSKSSEKSHKSSHKSKDRDKSYKSKHRDKSSHTSKLSNTHHSSGPGSSKTRDEKDTSADSGHRKRTRVASNPRHQKRSRLSSGSPSPQPSTSSGLPSLPRPFQRIIPPPGSISDAPSSSSSVVGVFSQASRCRRLSDSSESEAVGVGSDSGDEVVRRPVVRSAVVHARRAVCSGDSDSSDW